LFVVFFGLLAYLIAIMPNQYLPKKIRGFVNYFYQQNEKPEKLSTKPAEDFKTEQKNPESYESKITYEQAIINVVKNEYQSIDPS
jgi:hypothetical protein